MSSFIGHSLAAIGVYAFTQPQQQTRPTQSIGQKLWLFWLIAIASAPDIDYLIPALQSPAHQGLRITHSILVSLCLPVLAIVALMTGRAKGRKRTIMMLQLVGAGLSHLLLDLLVGVTPLPLFWPFSAHLFQLRFGLLPSAGRIALSNYYFYRNLSIELGVLLPLLAGWQLIRQTALRTMRQRLTIAALVMCSMGFMYWAACLPR